MSLIDSMPLQQARQVQLDERLSDREIEVLSLIALGHHSRGVADLLYVSKRTVDFHMANIFEKLGVNNRMLAVRKATQLGMLRVEMSDTSYPPSGL